MGEYVGDGRITGGMMMIMIMIMFYSARIEFTFDFKFLDFSTIFSNFSTS